MKSDLRGDDNDNYSAFWVQSLTWFRVITELIVNPNIQNVIYPKVSSFYLSSIGDVTNK